MSYDTVVIHGRNNESHSDCNPLNKYKSYIYCNPRGMYKLCHP